MLTRTGIAADIASGSARMVAGVTGALSWLPWALAAISMLGGVGGTVWYRMKWKDCVAETAQAIADQQEIDKADNLKRIGQLTNQLKELGNSRDEALERLANVPKTPAACPPSAYQRAVTDELCRLYPASKACRRP